MIDRERFQNIVRAAGELARAKAQDNESKLKHWDKNPGDPVSEGDIAVNRFLRHELTDLLPEAAWLSEESVDAPERLDSRRLWIVDPIDGTRDYINGRTGWAISVALVENQWPVAAMLYAPLRDEFWMAYAGEGTMLNGRRVQASRQQTLQGARVPADYLGEEDEGLVMVERPNSIALRMAKVADQRADMYASIRLGAEWDIAASALIVREAGALVTDVFGEPLRFNKPDPRAFGVLCSAPAVHAATVELLRDRALKLTGKDKT